MAYGKIKADTITYDNSGSDVDTSVSAIVNKEGTSVTSTGETGGTKFLREDGDGTCSWQTIPEDTDKADKAGPTFTGDVTFDSTTNSGRDAVWDESDSSLKFADNAKIEFGGSDDLQIYHDSSDSYIKEAGTGNLIIQADNLILENASGANYLAGISGGEVILYHNDSAKVTTTSSGVDITGTATVDGVDIDGSYKQGVEVITPGTSPTINCAEGNYFTLDLSSTNVSGTWTFTNVPTTKSFAIAIEITTGASTTIAWNSVSVNGGGGANTIKWNGGAAPTLGASKPSVVILTTDDTGASWYGSALVDFATV